MEASAFAVRQEGLRLGDPGVLGRLTEGDRSPGSTKWSADPETSEDEDGAGTPGQTR